MLGEWLDFFAQSCVFYVRQRVERAKCSCFQNTKNYQKRFARSVATSIFPWHFLGDPEILDHEILFLGGPEMSSKLLLKTQYKSLQLSMRFVVISLKVL